MVLVRIAWSQRSDVGGKRDTHLRRLAAPGDTLTQPTTRAPLTGPTERRTARQTPSALSATLRSTAAGSPETRNAQVGPEPDTMAPRAPYSCPACSTWRS